MARSATWAVLACAAVALAAGERVLGDEVQLLQTSVGSHPTPIVKGARKGVAETRAAKVRTAIHDAMQQDDTKALRRALEKGKAAGMSSEELKPIWDNLKYREVYKPAQERLQTYIDAVKEAQEGNQLEFLPQAITMAEDAGAPASFIAAAREDLRRRQQLYRVVVGEMRAKAAAKAKAAAAKRAQDAAANEAAPTVAPMKDHARPAKKGDLTWPMLSWRKEEPAKKSEAELAKEQKKAADQTARATKAAAMAAGRMAMKGVMEAISKSAKH